MQRENGSLETASTATQSSPARHNSGTRAVLGPNHNVQQALVNLPSSDKQLAQMVPRHENEMHGTIFAMLSQQLKGLRQELDELL